MQGIVEYERQDVPDVPQYHELMWPVLTARKTEAAPVLVRKRREPEPAVA